MRRKSIVTRRGDGGDTGLLYGGRVSKTDPRTEAYGDVDEAISALGLARALCRHARRRDIMLRVQRELFTVGAELATDVKQYDKLVRNFAVITPEFTRRVEDEVTELEARVKLPRAFVIPGGSVSAAAIDVARTVLRRAERRIVTLKEQGQLRNPEVLRYVNRLSDLIFMLARAEEGAGLVPLTGTRAVRRPPAPPRTQPAPRRRRRA